VASLFRKSLETLGVACDTQELDGGTLLDRCRKHQFQSVAFVWGPGADPDTSRTVWTTQASHSEAGSNFISYSNPQVDRLFEQGRREFDPEKRAAIYHEIQRLISADHALTFLYIRASFFAVSRDLRGFNYSPRGPFSYTPGILSLWKRRPEGPAPAPIKPEEPR
jgi:peptide/nickel transport system substrate-binding protein